jgi:hypothetical protein
LSRSSQGADAIHMSTSLRSFGPGADWGLSAARATPCASKPCASKLPRFGEPGSPWNAGSPSPGDGEFVAQPSNRLRYKCPLGEGEFSSEFFRFRRLDSELLTERCKSRQEAFSGVKKPCVAHGAPYPARPANELRITTDGF